MPRPPLPIGTHGKITTYEEAPKHWRAYTKYRDYDGVTRRVARSGKSKASAERSLKQALTERPKSQGGDLTADTKFREVAKQWLDSIRAAAEAGERSPTTPDQYSSNLERNVLPALGELRLREVTVPRVDALLLALRKNKSAATAKTARSIVSGVLGLAVRHGALSANATREVTRIEGGTKNAPQALTFEERTQWLAQLEADEKAVRWDLPDLSRFMLATGVRVGESLAVTWSEVNLEQGIAEVNHNVVRVKGKGLVRKSTKSKYGERTLPLPSWVVTMLKERFASTDDPDGPVFPDSLGSFRDPSNTLRVLRETRGSEGFAWVTSHVFRKTAATILDDAGLSARLIADQLGHSRPSMTQDVYLGRKAVSRRTADALETALDGSRND